MCHSHQSNDRLCLMDLLRKVLQGLGEEGETAVDGGVHLPEYDK